MFQVTEVIANNVRWSINGWFHSDEALNIPNLDYHYISGQVLTVEGVSQIKLLLK